MNIAIKFSILLCFSFFIIQCSSNAPSIKNELHIYNSNSEQAKEKFHSLNLDEKYNDLLSNTESKKTEEVTTAFSDFAYSISDYLEETGFEWEIPDSTLNVFMRGYFNSDGHLEHFLYNVKSGDVSQEKKEEFGEAIKPFLKDIKFTIEQDNKFVQCGTVQYWTK